MASVSMLVAQPTNATAQPTHRHHQISQTEAHYANAWEANGALRQVQRIVVYELQQKQLAQAAAERVKRKRVVHVAPAVVAPTSIAAVMQCIKDHESGVYTRNNHGRYGASGAYQIVKSTWDHWSVLAGHGGYDQAYLAPRGVQDAVVIYMLTRGGASNWSTKFGNDPCTM